MDERKERIGKNEALFRAVNERVRELEPGPSDPESFEMLCECGDRECVEQIPIQAADYERLRGHPGRFAVVEGHEKPFAETVVASTDRYHVVEKHPGGPLELARETDPRS